MEFNAHKTILSGLECLQGAVECMNDLRRSVRLGNYQLYMSVGVQGWCIPDIGSMGSESNEIQRRIIKGNS